MASKFVSPNYLPGTLEKRAQWLGNFSATLAPEATNLGVSAPQQAYVQAAAAWYGYLLNQYLPYVRTFSKAGTSLLEELDSDPTPQATIVPTFAPPVAPAGAPDSGAFNIITALVNDTILKSPNLTPSLKTALGLDPLPGPDPTAPRIKDGTPLPICQVELNFTRGGNPLVIIECRRGTDVNFAMLDKVAATHWVDLRTNQTSGRSEVREYRIRYSDGTQAIGNYSPTLSVATQP